MEGTRSHASTITGSTRDLFEHELNQAVTLKREQAIADQFAADEHTSKVPLLLRLIGDPLCLSAITSSCNLVSEMT